MKISTRGRYGLRLLVNLAACHGQGPVTVERLSANQNISANYIHQLLGSIRGSGLIRATRGAKGGYELARDPREISAFDVVSLLEGDLGLSACTTDQACCPRIDICATQRLWMKVSDSIRKIMQSHSLHDLARENQFCQEDLAYEI